MSKSVRGLDYRSSITLNSAPLPKTTIYILIGANKIMLHKWQILQSQWTGQHVGIHKNIYRHCYATSTYSMGLWVDPIALSWLKAEVILSPMLPCHRELVEGFLTQCFPGQCNFIKTETFFRKGIETKRFDKVKSLYFYHVRMRLINVIHFENIFSMSKCICPEMFWSPMQFNRKGVGGGREGGEGVVLVPIQNKQKK